MFNHYFIFAIFSESYRQHTFGSCIPLRMTEVTRLTTSYMAACLIETLKKHPSALVVFFQGAIASAAVYGALLGASVEESLGCHADFGDS